MAGTDDAAGATLGRNAPPAPQAATDEVTHRTWIDAPTAALALVTATFLAMVRPLTLPATAGVVVSGGVLVYRGLGMSREERRRVPAALTRRAVLVWWVPLLAFAGLEITNDALGSTYSHPTLSILLDPVTNAPLGRFVGVLVWLALGDYLVRR